MKSFLIKILVFMSVLISFYLAMVYALSQGYVDDYYKKFTQPAGSLIIGLSTASEGLVPDMVENDLKSFDFEWPMVNFALDGTQSRFGDMYFEGIKKKLKQTTTKKQLFILSVSPGSFAAQKHSNDEDVNNMDKNSILGKVTDFTSNPNYNYIINTYGLPLYNALHSEDQWNHQTTHDNGWNETQWVIQGDTIAESDMKYWKWLTLRYLNKTVKDQVVSKYRKNSFIELLTFLKAKGTVMLVRLPADKEVLSIENNFWPDFDTYIEGISKTYQVPYFNYTYKPHGFKTYDGLHLESESAKKVTKMLTTDLKDHLLNLNNPKNYTP